MTMPSAPEIPVWLVVVVVLIGVPLGIGILAVCARECGISREDSDGRSR